MSDNTDIQNKINKLEEKISDCTTAKTDIDAVKKDCTSKKDDWQSSYNVLANDQDLASVVKTDIFEGSMADSLKTKVSSAMTKISTGIGKAGTLENSLDTQSTALEAKISEFEAEIAALKLQMD